MSHPFYVCDEFADQRYAGNPLAVVPDAIGISAQRMQRIAQSVETGGPNILNVRVCKQAGQVSQSWVSGPSVMVAEGVLR